VLAAVDLLLPEQATPVPEGSFFGLPGGAYGDGLPAELVIDPAPVQGFTAMVETTVLEGVHV
jgi:hypothetical protein